MNRFIFIGLLLPSIVFAQVDFISSYLPIIRLSTDSLEITADRQTSATLEIIWNGPQQINFVTDVAQEYSGYCGVKYRGESSLDFEKKSYSLELWDENGNDIDSSFLGFSSEEDFILYGPYSDKTLINNVLTMSLARGLGQYASQTRFVELIVNNDYRGLYVLMEKIKRDKERVNISKLNPEDNSGNAITGGYIVRIDHSDGEGGWSSNFKTYQGDELLQFQYYYPKDSEITQEQGTYIQSYVDSFELAMASPDYRYDNIKHYTRFIDLGSFVDNFIINELVKNVDAYRLSSYFHKDKDSKGGKLKAGPIWDYNLSLGNASYCGTSVYWGWMYYSCISESPFWWDRLFHNFTFTTALRCRWEALRKNSLATDSLLNTIDGLVDEMGDAVDRNFKRWPVLGSYVWPNSDATASFSSHDEAIGFLKTWLPDRLRWMDNNIPGKAENCSLFDDPNFELEDLVATTISHRPSIQVYPNPANDFLNVISTEPILKLSLLNNLGQTSWTKSYDNKQKISLNLSGQNLSGYYTLLIKTRAFSHHQVIILKQ